ncbi:MAG: hypothetical protein PVI03_02010 [Candidatus Thorarchaeota archaeon]|jgi:hypothetical protein
MGIIGEKLKEKGWSKTKIEWLSIGITLLFFAVLIWFVFQSAILEGKCKATLLTGEKVLYDPNDPPNFTEQLVYINLSFMLENCTRVTHTYLVWECNYTYDYDDCWVGVC